MKTYHKIDTVFARDMEGSKKLIEGKFRNPLVEYLRNNEWVFTEKIDGTNIRVHWDGHEVSFGGRTDKAEIQAHLLEKLRKIFATREAEEIFEEKFGETEVTLYGEGYGEKIQKNGHRYGELSFMLFDVRIGYIFLERDSVEDIARAFGIPIVPVVLTGTIDDAINYVRTHDKSICAAEEHELEGLVGTPKIRINDAQGNRIIVKIKKDDFA
jgi:hypothetical protein